MLGMNWTNRNIGLVSARLFHQTSTTLSFVFYDAKYNSLGRTADARAEGKLHTQGQGEKKSTWKESGTTCQKNKGVGGETWREQACGNSE